MSRSCKQPVGKPHNPPLFGTGKSGSNSHRLNEKLEPICGMKVPIVSTDKSYASCFWCMRINKTLEAPVNPVLVAKEKQEMTPIDKALAVPAYVYASTLGSTVYLSANKGDTLLDTKSGRFSHIMNLSLNSSTRNMLSSNTTLREMATTPLYRYALHKYSQYFSGAAIPFPGSTHVYDAVSELLDRKSVV